MQVVLMAGMMRTKRPACARGRCKRPAVCAGWCKTHATQEADRLFSLWVRSIGRCQAKDGRPCSGGLQCAHGFSRRYRNTRWDPDNAWCLCQAHHTYYTHRPIEWDLWMLDRQGVEDYVWLREQALRTTKVDLEPILDWLKGATA